MLKTGGEQTTKPSAGAPGVADAGVETDVLSRFGVTLGEVKLQ